MAEKKPLCNYSGEIKELQTGDTFPQISLPTTYSNIDGGSAIAIYTISDLLLDAGGA